MTGTVASILALLHVYGRLFHIDACALLAAWASYSSLASRY
jgi:hypothetical protein